MDNFNTRDTPPDQKGGRVAFWDFKIMAKASGKNKIGFRHFSKVLGHVTYFKEVPESVFLD